jgi:hypothetical protein
MVSNNASLLLRHNNNRYDSTKRSYGVYFEQYNMAQYATNQQLVNQLQFCAIDQQPQDTLNEIFKFLKF